MISYAEEPTAPGLRQRRGRFVNKRVHKPLLPASATSWRAVVGGSGPLPPSAGHHQLDSAE